MKTVYVGGKCVEKWFGGLVQDDRRKSRDLHSGGLNYFSSRLFYDCLHSGGLNYFSSWLFCNCLHSGAPVRGGRRGQVLL